MGLSGSECFWVSRSENCRQLGLVTVFVNLAVKCGVLCAAGVLPVVVNYIMLNINWLLRVCFIRPAKPRIEV